MTAEEILDLQAEVRHKHTFTGQPDRQVDGIWWRECRECGELVVRHAAMYGRHQDQKFAEALAERLKRTVFVDVSSIFEPPGTQLVPIPEGDTP